MGLMLSQAWCCTLVFQALGDSGRWREKDREFEAHLGNIKEFEISLE